MSAAVALQFVILPYPLMRKITAMRSLPKIATHLLFMIGPYSATCVRGIVKNMTQTKPMARRLGTHTQRLAGNDVSYSLIDVYSVTCALLAALASGRRNRLPNLGARKREGLGVFTHIVGRTNQKGILKVQENYEDLR